MYRVTFTSLIAVSLLLVFVHSIRNFEVEDDVRPGGPVNNPPNRFNAQAVGGINSPRGGVRLPLSKFKSLGINKGGEGGAGSVQVQQGDGGKSRISGGSGGRGGFVKGTGSQNTGGTGGSGSVQLQQGANSESDTSGGNGGDGGGVLRKRRFSLPGSSNDILLSSGQNVGGKGGDGNVQIQSQDGSSSDVSGGNGGAGGNVVGSQPGVPSGISSGFPSGVSSDFPSGVSSGFPSGVSSDFPSGVSSGFPSGQSVPIIREDSSAEKRHSSIPIRSNNFPSSRGVNRGGDGGNGNVQVQGGGRNDVSGGNGGAGGNVVGSQSGFPSRQSFPNIQDNLSLEKRGLRSNQNVSSVDPVDQ